MEIAYGEASRGKDSLGQRPHLHPRSHGSNAGLSTVQRFIHVTLHSISFPLRLAKRELVYINGQRVGGAHFHLNESKLNNCLPNSHHQRHNSPRCCNPPCWWLKCSGTPLGMLSLTPGTCHAPLLGAFSHQKAARVTTSPALTSQWDAVPLAESNPSTHS